MKKISSPVYTSKEEQKQGFCLTDYLTDVFNYKPALHRGVKIKPVVFKLKDTPSLAYGKSCGGTERPTEGTRNGSCPNFMESPMNTRKSRGLHNKSWQSSKELSSPFPESASESSPHEDSPSKSPLAELKETSQKIISEVDVVKNTELFMLAKNAQALSEHLKKEQLLGLKLKERLRLKNIIAKKLTKKLAAFRVNTMGEDPIKEESDESKSDREDEENHDTSSENELPIPLEKLSTEVNKLMTSGKPLPGFCRSFTGGNSRLRRSGQYLSLEKSSSGYYSEYSGLEEDYLSSNSGIQSEKAYRQNSEDGGTTKHIKWTPNDASKECQVCSRLFTWYRWRHHCRRCGKLVCHECSLQRGKMEGYGGGKVRICDECKRGKLKKVHSILGDVDLHPLKPKVRDLT